MAKRVFMVLLMLVSTMLCNSLALAAEPTLHEVYQAADGGRMSDAQAMMSAVLAAHPDSGKAHFVEAELLAKQGLLPKAQAEFALAEHLAPGLPFAKPSALQALKARLGSASAVAGGVAPVRLASSGASGSLPWGVLLLGFGLIAALAWFARALMSRNPLPNQFPATGANYGSMPPAYGGGTGGWPAGAQPGLGSRVMGGLATGAAVGAGVVAGEALMNRFLGDGERHGSRVFDNAASPTDSAGFDDLGGNDFGVSDATSWDDTSVGGDWN